MAPRKREARPAAFRVWVPYVVLLSTVLLTMAVAYSAAKAAEGRERLRFHVAAEHIRGAIQQRIEAYVAMLVSGTALFSASGEVSRAEFHAFVEHLDLARLYPGIQGIGYSVRVPAGGREALVASARQDGIDDFTIRPEFERPEVHAILYLEPQDRRNRVALGFDMFSEPVRRAAMERARDTAEPAASGRVTLVQEIDTQKQAGFLIYVPVYRGGALPKTTSERKSALRGFVYSPFRAGDLLNEILASDGDPDIHLRIFDGDSTREEALLYASSEPAPSSGDTVRSVRSIDVAGRTWTIVATARPSFEAAANATPYILGGGGLVSLLLFGVTRAQVQARDAAEQSAAKLARSEEALRMSEQHLRNVLDGVSVFVSVMRPDGTLVEANQAMLSAAELQLSEVVGKPFDETSFWTHDEATRRELRASIERAREGEAARFDARMRLGEDRFVTVDLSITPLLGEDDEVCYLIASGTDITGRIETERERARLREEVIRMQEARLEELSTPLIPLVKGVILMPLVGSIDTARAQRVLEAVAFGVGTRRARVAIIDITGVTTIDTQVAALLVRTAEVVRLLGAEVVLTGVSPEVAQTMVRLEVDLSGIMPCGDLQSGIAYAMRRPSRAKA